MLPCIYFLHTHLWMWVHTNVYVCLVKSKDFTTIVKKSHNVTKIVVNFLLLLVLCTNSLDKERMNEKERISKWSKAKFRVCYVINSVRPNPNGSAEPSVNYGRTVRSDGRTPEPQKYVNLTEKIAIFSQIWINLTNRFQTHQCTGWNWYFYFSFIEVHIMYLMY